MKLVRKWLKRGQKPIDCWEATYTEKLLGELVKEEAWNWPS